jgi:hypothetical protein
MPLLHAVLLAPFWSIGTLVRGGSFQRDQRNTINPIEGHICIKNAEGVKVSVYADFS